MGIHRFRFAALLAGALLTGCAALPDAQPFADSSAQLAGSTRAAGAALTQSLQAAQLNQATEVGQAWAARVQAADAMARYGEQVAGLAAAGNLGRDSAGKLGGALTDLLKVTVTAQITAVVDIAKTLYEQAARAAAAQQLDQAFQQAQPVVDAFADALDQDLDKRVVPLLQLAQKQQAADIASADGGVDKRNLLRAYELRLAALQQTALNAPTPQARQDATAEGTRLEPLFAGLQADRAARQKALADMNAAYAVRRALVNQLSEALHAWAQAHRDLAQAVRDKRKVDVTTLLSTTQELRDLIRKVRTT
ncbi:hypothetical protein [Ramlibacter sp.]|uniref:hypothetical protein n=1 Tax=Ramlibacter sp. TaxID=1917967 RepID=UPI00184EDF61|nr:hypothetical protein [Ramlibacter sp.]MBA2675429.1 hypothetical protein [Ramlibacter sp.]